MLFVITCRLKYSPSIKYFDDSFQRTSVVSYRGISCLMLYGWTEQNSVYVILFACLKYLKYFILGIGKVDITRTLCISQTDISHKEMLAASLRYLDFSFGLLLLATPLWPQKVFVRLSVMRVTVKLLGVFDMLSADQKIRPGQFVQDCGHCTWKKLLLSSGLISN